MPPTVERRRRGFLRGRGRTILLVSVLALVVLAMSLKGIATFYTDFLWFRSLGYSDVWRGVLGARVVLAFIFIGLFFVLCWVNLFIADRIAPVFRPPGPEEELLEPYHAFIAHRIAWARVGVALLFAVIAGAGASSQWNDWILFTNRVDFGIDDPQFGKDIGFYVFQLPFLSFVVNWLFFSFVMILLITAVAHYLNGGIRLQTPGERVTPQVKAHLSLLLGVLALIKVGDYYLARFELTSSSRGVVDGATYTDVNVQLPALNLLMAISVLSFILLVINIRRRGWQLPAVTVGLWAFVAIVAGNIYPAFVQRFSVDPAESSKEAEYVARNIAATRHAYGLDGIEVEPFDYTNELTPSDVEANLDNVESARILDPAAMRNAFQLEQGLRTYYRFGNELDLDRYQVDGKTTEVVIGARELNPSDRNGWENAHLAYTHGHGVALAPANEVNRRGRPEYVVKDVPQVVTDRINTSIETPQIYFGENLGGYSIVNTGRNEVDYTDEQDNEVLNRYDGAGGVELGSFFRRAAFAIRFGQIDPLISDFVNSDSRVIYKRDVRERVEAIAPFLKWDSDPYPVVTGDRVHYVLDGFTTTDRYPYAQSSSGGGGALSGGGINYVRNSVKAVVDAYDGTMALYVIPDDKTTGEGDPIIRAYQKAFPNLFRSFDTMSPELREHLRYPQDLFKLQTNMWARYHEGEAAAFLSGSGRWSVAQNAPRQVRATNTDGQTTVQATSQQAQEQRVDPYYALLRLPGESQQSYVTLRTFVAFNEDDSLRQLTSMMVADSSGDPERYGRLKAYEFTNTNAPGPAAVSGNINAKQEIASQISLVNQQGSTVEYGDLLVIPMNRSILYVRPLYVISRDSEFPGLQGVIVSNGENVEIGGSLGEALDKLFRGSNFTDLLGATAVTEPPAGDGEDTPEPDTPEPDAPEPGTVDERIRALVAQIVAAQADIDAALQESPPDHAAAGRAQNELRELLDQLAQISGVPAVPAGGSSQSGGAAASSGTGQARRAGQAGEGPSGTTTSTTAAPMRPASA